ncbi:hypothetical protein [Microbacterium sp. H83]|uniref:hypothetical protein n=1 Tax=Microbacterium sp. H83 TaxID=1827324 RepID=UPI000A836B90|nr:hypothetical protein [Microbacterium sp. H83]
MHSIAPWETETVVTAWAKSAARRHLREAIDALDDARVRLIGLAEDTEWHSDGVRAMHEKLSDLQRRTAAVAGSVRFRQSEIEGVPIP